MTSKLTREERIQCLYDLKIGQVLNQSDIENIKMLARMALAALDSEPVAWTSETALSDVACEETSMIGQEGVVGSIPLYRHAQQPVVPILTRADFENWCQKRFAPSPSYFEKDANGVYTSTLVHDLYVAWEGYRAAMLQAKPACTCPSGDGSLRWPCPVHPGNSPVIGIDLASGPDRTVEVRYVAPPGYVMVPMRLTAENGAKGALSGEFSETKFINCPECFGDDECETCDGSGRIEITVPVTWTTIKEIWVKGVEHFAAAPQGMSKDE